MVQEQPAGEKEKAKDADGKKAEPKAELSAEDAELRDALLLMVTRASDPEPGVQRLALEGLRREIRSATRHADLSLR